jgi:NADH dehydrogenase (ubiquinone) 1 beta subcomplex subunit 8
MLSRRLVAARPLTRALVPATSLRTFSHTSQLRVTQADIEDPDMVMPTILLPMPAQTNRNPSQNGGYVSPPAEKRIQRDPYGEWWDKQERRNYGEPVHEDNDILGVFSTEKYTHFTPGWGAVLMGTFIASFGALCGVVYLRHPDKPSVPRTFPNGLEAELGGKSALPVC